MNRRGSSFYMQRGAKAELELVGTHTRLWRFCHSPSLTFQETWHRAHTLCLCKPCRPSGCSQFLLRWPMKKKRELSRWLAVPQPTLCMDPRFTHCATGVGSAMEKCARHPDDLGLHLPHAREDVWVKRVAPCKISINLGTVGKYLHELQIFTRTEVQYERKNTRGNHKRRCGGGNVFTAANAKQVNPYSTTLLKVYNKETRYQPSPGVWSVTHHPSTPHQTHTHFPNPPHLQDKQRKGKKKKVTFFLKLSNWSRNPGAGQAMKRTGVEGELTYSESRILWFCPEPGSGRGLWRAAAWCSSSLPSGYKDWQTCHPAPYPADLGSAINGGDVDYFSG